MNEHKEYATGGIVKGPLTLIDFTGCYIPLMAKRVKISSKITYVKISDNEIIILVKKIKELLGDTTNE